MNNKKKSNKKIKNIDQLFYNKIPSKNNGQYNNTYHAKRLYFCLINLNNQKNQINVTSLYKFCKNKETLRNCKNNNTL